MSKKNYTFNLNVNKLTDMQKWFAEKKPSEYASFNHFAELALEREFQRAKKSVKNL